MVFSLEDKPLHVSARVLTAEESKSILKHDLMARGYKPIEVTISNAGTHTYEISLASTSLSCIKPEAIAWKETALSIPRSLGFKIISFFFWPFTVASTIDSIHTLKNHKLIVKVLKAKGFKEEAETLLPYSLIKRILYAPEEFFSKTFTVALEDLTGDELVVVPVEAV